MFGGKKAKELEEELLALREKQNRLQEQISNIAKAKDSAEETLVQMTISKTELDETITAVSEELELLKECSEANSGQTVLLKQQLAKKNEQNIRLQQEKEALCQQMEGEHEKIAKVVEKNKYVTTPMKEIESFYEAYCQERESVEEALQKLADISQNMGVLALGAAIEAGRMGEDGRKFVTEAEKQIHALNDLLKENNGSLVKLLEDRDTEAVETDHENVEEETNIEEILESLCQGENEFFEVQSRVLSKAETLRQEWKEHKECADELERNVEEVHRFVQTE